MDINKPIRPYDAIFTNIISRISYGVMELPMMNIAVNSNNQQHNVIRHFFKYFFCSSLVLFGIFLFFCLCCLIRRSMKCFVMLCSFVMRMIEK